MKTAEVAQLLGTTDRAVYRLVERGVLKAYRRGPRRRLIFDTVSVLTECQRRKGAT